MANLVITQRLWLTAGKDRVVPEGDPDAAYLYAVPGREVDLDQAAAFGVNLATGGLAVVAVAAAGEPVVDLQKMKLAELQALAVEAGADPDAVKAARSKADAIALLEQAKAAKADAGDGIPGTDDPAEPDNTAPADANADGAAPAADGDGTPQP